MITHITPRETELARQIDEQGGQLVRMRDALIEIEKALTKAYDLNSKDRGDWVEDVYRIRYTARKGMGAAP
jgi:hypothetical protein